MSTNNPRKATTIELEQDGNHWRAYQPGVEGLVGVGPNPGRAVANYGTVVAETVYECDEGEQELEAMR